MEGYTYRRAPMPARTAARSPAGWAAKPLPSTKEDETGGKAATLLAGMATARTAGEAETSMVWRSARPPDRTSTKKTARVAAMAPTGKAGTIPAKEAA